MLQLIVSFSNDIINLFNHFLVEYPFKGPKIFIKTPIYHPNVAENGAVCMPLISDQHWKQDTKAETIIMSLVALINHPEPTNYLRRDLAIGKYIIN